MNHDASIAKLMYALYRLSKKRKSTPFWMVANLQNEVEYRANLVTSRVKAHAIKFLEAV